MKLTSTLYYIITGLQEWSQVKQELPANLKVGHYQLGKLMLSNNKWPPTDLVSLLKLLQTPIMNWGIQVLEQSGVPLESPILSPSGQLTDAAMDFLHIYISPEEAQSREVLNILRYCRNAPNMMDKEYVEIRSFLTKNAVITGEELYFFALKYPRELSEHIIACYEEFSEKSNHFRKCPRCGWTLSYLDNQWKCGTYDLCGQIEARPLEADHWDNSNRLFRLQEGVHRYTLLPGLAELKIKRNLERNGYAVGLYPNVDEFDLAVMRGNHTVYLDVKDFTHPLTLAYFFNNMPHDQLKKYIKEPNLLIVIPDYRRVWHASYKEQVDSALKESTSQLKVINEREIMSTIERWIG